MAALDDSGEPLEERQIDLPISEHIWVGLESVDNELIVLLDRSDSGHQLWTYSTSTDEPKLLAERGQGPGDLMFPTDIAVNASRVSISLADRRISTFDCNLGECVHKRDVRIDFQPVGVGGVGHNFAVMGTRPLQGVSTEPFSTSIQIVDTSGTVVDSFGQPYDTQHWMVSEQFIRNGSLSTGPGGWYTLFYGDLPFVYVYGPNGNLERVGEIESFLQGTFTYENGHRSIIREDDYTRIVNSRIINDAYIFLTAKSTIRSAPRTQGHKTLYAFDYYLVPRNMECAMHLGREEVATRDGGHEWVVTDHHLLRVRDNFVYVAE